VPSPFDLQEDAQHQDLTFLADQTGIARVRLALSAVAQRLTGSGNLPG
jgi:hypothetical protein